MASCPLLRLCACLSAPAESSPAENLATTARTCFASDDESIRDFSLPASETLFEPAPSWFTDNCNLNPRCTARLDLALRKLAAGSSQPP